MADINIATTMMNYYTDNKPQIRGRTVYIQFSNHEQLKTESSSQVGVLNVRTSLFLLLFCVQSENGVSKLSELVATYLVLISL